MTRQVAIDLLIEYTQTANNLNKSLDELISQKASREIIAKISFDLWITLVAIKNLSEKLIMLEGQLS